MNATIQTTATLSKEVVEEIPERELVDILVFPNHSLYHKARKVTKEDRELVEELKEVMTHTLEHYQGLGLAANQIGAELSVLKFSWQGYEDFLINPKIIDTGEKQISEEGCLSFPMVVVEVERHFRINVRHDVWNEDTNDYVSQTTEFEGHASAIIQHEIDHLNGIVFIKYLSDLKRSMVTSKMKKLKRRVKKFKKMMEQFA
jgi:peptide deformylase